MPPDLPRPPGAAVGTPTVSSSYLAGALVKYPILSGIISREAGNFFHDCTCTFWAGGASWDSWKTTTAKNDPNGPKPSSAESMSVNWT